MFGKSFFRLKSRTGQTVVEYFIWFLLVGLATIVGLQFFYNDVQTSCHEAVYNVMEQDFMR
ncbi:hypothetical protein ACFL2I_03310 [Candidatus Omnitrophota bacterium]